MPMPLSLVPPKPPVHQVWEGPDLTLVTPPETVESFPGQALRLLLRRHSHGGTRPAHAPASTYSDAASFPSTFCPGRRPQDFMPLPRRPVRPLPTGPGCASFLS